MTVAGDTDIVPILTKASANQAADDAAASDESADSAASIADGADNHDHADPSESPQRRKHRARAHLTAHRQALLVGVAMAAAMAALTCWLGSLAWQSNRTAEQRAMFLQAGRQGAQNTTTIDWQHADADVQRILNAATGTFYSDFSKRTQQFIDVLKQAQSKSEGTITDAGLESASATNAQVLVAVTVKISNAVATEQNPREWRMRISVQKVGSDVKVSNVEFVP